MLFFWNVDPGRFPFTIGEGPIPLEETSDKEMAACESGLSGELEAMPTRNTGFEKDLPGQADPLNSEQEKSKEATDDFGGEFIGSAQDLLLVMDGLEACLNLGMQAGNDDEHNELFGKLLKNIELIRLKLEGALASLNIVKLKSVGAIFDAKLHIPVGVESVSGKLDYMITEEKLPGYTRRGKVVRHAKVIVAKSDS